MNFHVIEKQVLDAQDFDQKAGMIDIYACSCGYTMLYVYSVAGKTPGRMTCPKCDCETCFSSVTSIRQPDMIWYRPDGEKELRQLAQYAFELLDKEVEYDTILNNYITHYNDGGLFAKETGF